MVSEEVIALPLLRKVPAQLRFPIRYARGWRTGCRGVAAGAVGASSARAAPRLDDRTAAAAIKPSLMGSLLKLCRIAQGVADETRRFRIGSGPGARKSID